MKDQLKRLLAELVAIDSTSTLSNAPMIDLLEQRLRTDGFACHRQRYRDEAGIEKINLIGVRRSARYGQTGAGAGRSLGLRSL